MDRLMVLKSEGRKRKCHGVWLGSNHPAGPDATEEHKRPCPCKGTIPRDAPYLRVKLLGPNNYPQERNLCIPGCAEPFLGALKAELDGVCRDVEIEAKAVRG